MKILQGILTVLLLIISVNCTSKKQQIATMQLPLSKQNIPISAGIIGEWYYSFPFYSSKLTLLENGTFSYFDQGCLGKSYSEGNWHYEAQYITCRSFDIYKQETEPIETVVKSEPVSTPKTKGKKKSKKIEYSLDLSQFNFTVSHKFPDTSNIYLDNVRYRIENGILQQLDQYGSTGDIKYRRGDFRTMPTIPAPVLPETWKINK